MIDKNLTKLALSLSVELNISTYEALDILIKQKSMHQMDEIKMILEEISENVRLID